MAYLDLLEGHVDDDGREHLETIDEAADDAIEISETARDLSKTILQEGDGELISLPNSISREVSNVRDTFETAVLDVEEPLPDVLVEADDMLDSALLNPQQAPGLAETGPSFLPHTLGRHQCISTQDTEFGTAVQKVRSTRYSR